MRSARALGRRAAALAHRCRAECKPVLDAVRRAEVPSWETVQPLVDAVEGLEDEALALSDRAQEVFKTVAKVNGVPEVEAPSSFPSSCIEWQEWEAEACYCAVEAPRREWVGWWREGQLVARQPTSSAIRVQAAVRGWAVRRRMAECVLDACSDGDDSDEYMSAEEDDPSDGCGGHRLDRRRVGAARLVRGRWRWRRSRLAASYRPCVRRGTTWQGARLSPHLVACAQSAPRCSTAMGGRKLSAGVRGAASKWSRFPRGEC